MSWAMTEKTYSQRRACALVGIDPRVYNHHRPRTSLDGLTPREFRNRSREDQNLNRLSF